MIEDELNSLFDNKNFIDLCEKFRKHMKNDQVKKWIDNKNSEYVNLIKKQNSYDSSLLLPCSCIFGMKLVKDKATSTQLRKLLNNIQTSTNSSEELGPGEKSRLKLNLAYITSRSSEMKPLTYSLDTMLNNVETKEEIKMLIEGTIAYHKLTGGRD